MFGRFLTACMASLAIGNLAQAQLVMSSLDGSPTLQNPVGAWYIDVTTGQSTPLWHGHPWTFAVRDNDATVYFPAGSMWRWSYAAPSDPVHFGGLGNYPVGQQLPMDGATFAHGRFWGVPECCAHVLGLYEIVLSAPGQMSYAHLRKPANYQWKGLTFDPASDLFFAGHKGSPPTGGIYSIDYFGTGAIVKVAPLPPGVTVFGGLTWGNGKLYLTPAGAGAIYIFDLASGAYEPGTLPSPSIGAPSSFSGGAGWAPSLIPAPLPPGTFCSPHPSIVGCNPRIHFNGMPSAAASSGFLISGDNVPAQKPGMLIYQVGGPLSEAPFYGLPICFGPTGIRRSPGMGSGGTTVCGGVYSLDMNAFAAGTLGGNPSPALRVPGSTIYCRFWGRDDFLWGGDVQLTDALEYGVRP